MNIEARPRDNGRIFRSAGPDGRFLLPREKIAMPNPTIASIRVAVNTILSPGKPAMAASIDDPVIKVE